MIALGAPDVGATSLVAHAMRRVREHIREHALKVGDTLPAEGRFATDLGVSRAVMREAFGALAALHLIDVGNGRRARVAAIDGSVMATSLDHAVATEQVSVGEVWEVRRTLELRTAALAAKHRSEADASEILAQADAMYAAREDREAMTRADLAFHQAIAQACGNVLFLQIVRSFEPLMRAAIPVAWATRTTAVQRRYVLDLHRSLAEAIRDGEADTAMQVMNDHFDSSIADLLASA